MRVLAVAVVVLLVASVIHAHEIGTTRVSVVVHESRRYEIEVVTDGSALVEKLAAVTGQSPRSSISRSALQPLLTTFDETFRQRVKIQFDSAADRPGIAYSVVSGVDASSAVATIRLTGTIPSDAHQFTWTYGWTFASYAMTVRDTASGSPATEWLEGGQTSAPFALRSPAPSIDR